ncbi:MAG: hypothetical protein ACRC92_14945 [Peptostreptococcaceae bacterium]
MPNNDTENSLNSYSNYSKTNGKDLSKNIDDIYIVKKIENNNCPSCNLENNVYNRYCKFCGSSLEELVKIKEEKKKILIKKEEIITGIVAVGILFLMAVVTDFAMSSQSNELGKLVNPIQIMMALNLGSIDLYSSTMLGSGAVNLEIGVLIFLLSPIIAISVSNLLFNKNKESISILSNIIGVGLTYGLLMAILSMFASISINNSELAQYGIVIKSRFNFVSIFINGFIISALCTYIVGFKKKDKEEIIYFKVLDSALKSIAIGYVLVLIILSIVTISDNTYLYEIGLYGYTNQFNIVTVLTQLAAYLWAFANFIPITIGSFSESAFSIINSNLFLDTKLIFYSLIALSLLIILISGYRLKDKYKVDNIKPVIYFAISYSAFMGILSTFSKIVLGGNISLFGSQNYQTSISMGFPLISTIIISFIYSFLVALIGYKLNENK